MESDYKIGERLYVNGEMDGREFQDALGVVAAVDRSRRRWIYLMSICRPDGSPPIHPDSWYVHKEHLSRKPLCGKDLEPAGITAFWKKHNII